jgi:Cu2+-exporting ATPase
MPQTGRHVMVTKVFEMEGPFGARDSLFIEDKLQRIAGVASIHINAAATTATIVYDQTGSTSQNIFDSIEECGFHCKGLSLPAYLCTSNSSA